MVYMFIILFKLPLFLFQVLLQVEVCGLCSRDVNLFQEGKLGCHAIEKPMIIGHEASGTVLKCGDCVKNLVPGDKVAIEPQVACRMCPLCKAGKYYSKFVHNNYYKLIFALQVNTTCALISISALLHPTMVTFADSSCTIPIFATKFLVI